MITKEIGALKRFCWFAKSLDITTKLFLREFELLLINVTWCPVFNLMYHYQILEKLQIAINIENFILRNWVATKFC